MPAWFLEYLKALDDAQKAELLAWFEEEPTAGDEVTDVLES